MADGAWLRKSAWRMGKLAVLVALATSCAATHSAAAEDALVAYPLTSDEHVSTWRGWHDVTAVKATVEGMRIAISGADPYLAGPPRDFPDATPLLLKMRLRSETGGAAQVFFYDGAPRESQSVRFSVPAGRWHDVVLPLPALGKNYRLRIDPPGTRGDCVIASLTLERPLNARFPDQQAPVAFEPGSDDRVLQSGDAILRHASLRWNDFSISWAGTVVASGHNRLPIGYWRDGRQNWVDLAGGRTQVTSSATADEIRVVAVRRDDEGATWRFERTFGRQATGGFRVETKVAVDQPRRVLFLPTLVVLPAFGAHAGQKTQALLAGVEYLENEPSSSEADLIGAAAIRRVPAAHKVTFPLMAVQQAGRYVALSWQLDENVAPLFDSPDRTLQSNAHLLALIAPGTDPRYRTDGQPLVHSPWELTPDRSVVHRADVWAGDGDSVVPAIQSYVKRHGLPALPAMPGLSDYVSLASAGWLDSPLRNEGRFRHAVGNNFGVQPAMDAAWMLEWLANLTTDAPLRQRLLETATSAAAAVAPGSEYFAHVGHLQQPTAGLVFDRYEATRIQARRQGRDLSQAFDADGVARYRTPAQGIDYGRTQPSREASGLSALPVLNMLRAAAYSGDRELLDAALERLSRLSRFDGGVPRGAQTWEIALHTPDILAAAHLVKAYVLAYRLTGDRAWLDRARYWAWTGVPFVYLTNPTGQEVGAYATIAVLGATHWETPVWIGLPVQWCGLVYAESLNWLAPHDPGGPWRNISSGIVASATRQTYPLGHPHQGLLPDSFDLLLQTRNPADINPGTLQPLALELLTGVPACDIQAWPARGQWVCVAGRASELTSDGPLDSLKVTPWRAAGSTAVIHGLKAAPQVRIDGQIVSPERLSFTPATGSLTVRLQDATPVRIELRHSAERR